MSDKRIDYSHNWNNKLYCEYFTSLRLSGRFVIGDKVTTFLKRELIGLTEVVGKKEIRLAQINDWMGMLDTGYPAAETQKILRTMYPEVPNWETQPIFYYLFHRTSQLHSLPAKPTATATLDLFTILPEG